MKNNKPTPNTPSAGVFIFPEMKGWEIDRFISWLVSRGYTVEGLRSATWQMQRVIYNQYAARYNKKRIP